MTTFVKTNISYNIQLILESYYQTRVTYPSSHPTSLSFHHHSQSRSSPRLASMEAKSVSAIAWGEGLNRLKLSLARLDTTPFNIRYLALLAVDHKEGRGLDAGLWTCCRCSRTERRGPSCSKSSA